MLTNKRFVYERLQFYSFAASAKSLQNEPKMDLSIMLKSSRIGAGGLLKAMPNMNMEINTNLMYNNLTLDQTCSKIGSQNGLRICSLILFGIFFQDLSLIHI